MKRPPSFASHVALCASVLFLAPAAAFAESTTIDAGSTADVAEDATATDAIQEVLQEDTGVTTDVAVSEVAPQDVAPQETSRNPDVPPPQDSTGTTSFNENPCWDTKCATETNACKASANCVKYKNCKDKACQDAIAKADAAAVKMFQDMEKCGYAACVDKTKGTCKDLCGKWSKTAPCNCDDACKTFNDCCADYDALCGEKPDDLSCKGKCGNPYDSKAKCQCDAECADNGDCCKDIDTVCKDIGPPPCTPVCVGKKCGEDDTCGKKCGGIALKCDDGGKCDSAGTCVGGGKPDATSGPDGVAAADGTGGANPDAAAGSDALAGKDGGTVAVPAPTAAASSGCTSSGSPTGNGMWLALVALFGAVLLRRRRTA